MTLGRWMLSVLHDWADRCVDVKNVHDCKWVDVKCPVFTVFAAWEIIVFKHNTKRFDIWHLRDQTFAEYCNFLGITV